jgi:MFS family permease
MPRAEGVPTGGSGPAVGGTGRRSDDPIGSSRGLRRTLVPVGGAFATLGLFMGAWTVATPEVERALGGGPGRLGLVLSAALVVAAGLNTAGGALAEHRGTTAALRATSAGWAVALAVGSVLPAPWGVALAAVTVLSVAGSVDVVANVAATAGLAHHPGRLVRLHAVYNVGGAMGTVLVGVLLGLTGAVGWRWAWATTAALVLVLLVATAGVELPAGHAGRKVPLSEGVRTLRRERLVPMAVAFALAAVVEGGVSTWGVLQLRGALDAGLLVGAAGAFLGYVVAVLARLSVSGVATAAAARRAIVGGTGLAAVGLLVLATVTHPVVAAGGLVVAAGGVSVCWPLLMSEVGRGRERPGVVVGALTTFGYLGQVIGPGLIGAVAGAFGVAAGLVVLAVCAATVPVLVLASRR